MIVMEYSLINEIINIPANEIQNTYYDKWKKIECNQCCFFYNQWNRNKIIINKKKSNNTWIRNKYSNQLQNKSITTLYIHL